MSIVTDIPFEGVPILEERMLGVYDDGRKGPTLICFCGIHGNEPSGLFAFRQVLDNLRKTRPNFRGKLIGLGGNLEALKAHQRFIDQDLNRVWSPGRMQEIDFGRPPMRCHEHHEQMELYNRIHEAIRERNGDIFFIDLHTTSSESAPFISINDTLRNRRMALKYPLPIVLGIEEYLEGTILNYINDLGHVALGFEAGQHDDPASITNHEAIIWISLFNCGCLDLEEEEDVFSHHHAVLSKNMIEGKSVFELRHRHGIESEDYFKMNPGYVNFQKISKDEFLAKDANGKVVSGTKGRIFMPLYQAQGDDGFFIIRKIRWFWLKLSSMLRLTDFHRFLHLLPGVGRYNRLNHSLTVNTNWARWFVIDFFHLMGFRRKHVIGKRMIFMKREFDVRGPS